MSSFRVTRSNKAGDTICFEEQRIEALDLKMDLRECPRKGYEADLLLGANLINSSMGLQGDLPQCCPTAGLRGCFVFWKTTLAFHLIVICLLSRTPIVMHVQDLHCCMLLQL